MRHIPFFKQLDDHSCGPATLQMVLGAYGIEITQKAAAEEARTTEEIGTSTAAIVAVLEKYGLKVEAGNGRALEDLKRATAEEKIVIICYTERGDNWGHYSLVLGFEDGNIILLDPQEENGEHPPFPTQEFEERWNDPLFTQSDHWAAFVGTRKVL